MDFMKLFGVILEHSFYGFFMNKSEVSVQVTG